MEINKELTQSLIDQNKPEPETTPTKEEFKPITSVHTPWRVRQQFLEQEDRVKARILKQSTADLEKAVGVEEVKDAS